MTANQQQHLIHGGRTLPATPLAGIDLNSGFMPVRRVFYYAGQPDIARLQHALAAALARWPDFAGTVAKHTINGRENVLCLLRNDTGARFSVVQVDTAVPPFGIDYPTGLPSPFCDESISQVAGDGGPVFTVKITQFNDGHWVLGTCNSHALCDGSGFWQFMQSWCGAFHGEVLPTIAGDFPRCVLPLADGEVVAVPSQLKQPAVVLLDKQIANLATYRTGQRFLPAAQLDALKQAVNAGLAPDWVSTQDALMALLWQGLAAIALRHGADPAQRFPLSNVINIRSRFSLEHYVGNMAYGVLSQATLAEITQASLAQLAQRLRQDSQQATDADMRQFLQFLQQQLDQGGVNSAGYFRGFSAQLAELCVDGCGVMVNNWSKFPAYRMHFGSTPLWFDLATVIPMHFVMVMPALDGVVVRYFLPADWLDDALAVLG